MRRGLLVWVAVGIFLGAAPREEARRLYETGVALASSEERYREALDAFERAYALDPSRLDALVAIGRAQRALGEIEAARATFEQALAERLPRPLARQALLGAIETALEMGDLDAAMSHLDAAKRVAAHDPAFAELRGRVLLESGDLEEARRALEQAWNSGRETAPLHRALARIYALEGKWIDVLLHAEEAIRLHPFHAETFFLLAKAHLHAGDPAEARAAMRTYQRIRRYEGDVVSIEKSASESPSDPSAWIQLAQMHAAQGDRIRALHAYERLAEFPEEAAFAWANVALLRMELGHRGAAEAALNRALRADDADPTVAIALGRWHAAHARWDKAEEAFRRAIELDSTLSAARVGLIQALASRRDFSGVEQAFREWTEAAPSSEAWQQYGLFLYQTGRTTDATSALEKAVALDPGNTDAANALAWMIAERGDRLDHAAALIRRAIGRVPTAALFDTLAAVEEKRGDLDAALRARTRAIRLAPENAKYRKRLESLRARLERRKR